MKPIPNSAWFAAGTLAFLAQLGGANAASYPETILADHPLAYFRFEDTVVYPTPVLATNLATLGPAANGTFSQGVVYQRTGALVGSSDTAIGITGSARVSVPFNEGLNPNGPFTVEAWANPTTTAGGRHAVANSMIAGANNNPDNSNDRSGWSLLQENGDWKFWFGGSDGNPFYTLQLTAAGTVKAQQWQHVVGVYDGANARIYVNGELAAEAAFSALLTNFAAPFLIGQRGYGDWNFAGGIDEVAIYPSALSATTVRSHYLNGINPTPEKAYPVLVTESSPAGYWRLDQPPQPPAPVAANAGSSGSDGAYFGGATSGTEAPRPPQFFGFSAVNRALDLNGTSAYVSALQSLMNDLPEYTVSGWLRRGGAQPNRTGLFGQNDLFEFGYITDDSLNAYTDAGDVSVTPQPFPDFEWHYVAVVRSSTNLTIYTDGLAAASVDAGATGNTPFAFNIGGGGVYDSSGNFFLGQIDEVALFPRALPPERIGAQYYSTVLGPPLVVREPEAVEVFEGEPVVLSAGVVGSEPLQYVWTRNSQVVAGATGPTLVIEHALPSNSGLYVLGATNTVSGTATAGTQVTVKPTVAPSILTQPDSATRYPGFSATLSVTATGGSLQYQWERDGAPIDRATNTTYRIDKVDTTTVGQYRVRVSNPVSSVLSSPATVALAVPGAGTFGAAVLALQPSHYWQLNETAGTTAFDYVGGVAGTYNGGVTLGVAGPSLPGLGSNSKGADFNGADGFVGTGTSLLNGRPAFTLTGWIKSNTDQADRTGLFGQNDVIEFGFIDAQTLEVYTAGGGAVDATTTTAIPVGEWHFVATVGSPAGVSLYVDGQSVGNDPTPTTNYGTSTYPFNIAGGGIFDTEGNFFAGAVSQVAIFDRALTAEEMAALYSAAVGVKKITYTFDGGQLILSWTVGQLYAADALTGTFAPVPGATSPFIVPLIVGQKYYGLQ